MFAAAKVAALDEIARLFQHRHSVLFCKCEDSRKAGDLDEAKVNGYMPKTIIELFHADAVF